MVFRRFTLLALLMAAIAAIGSQVTDLNGHKNVPKKAKFTPPLDGRNGWPLALENFRPRSMLRVAANDTPRAKFPVVDVHTHPQVRLEKPTADAAGNPRPRPSRKQSTISSV